MGGPDEPTEGDAREATEPLNHDFMRMGQKYTLTTNHAASSHGQPVLIAPDGKAYGPGDVVPWQEEGDDPLPWLGHPTAAEIVLNYYVNERPNTEDIERVVAFGRSYSRAHGVSNSQT